VRRRVDLFEVVEESARLGRVPGGHVLAVLRGVVAPNTEPSCIAACLAAQARERRLGRVHAALVGRRLVGAHTELLDVRLHDAAFEPLPDDVAVLLREASFAVYRVAPEPVGDALTPAR
jgi:hypothetical protein